MVSYGVLLDSTGGTDHPKVKKHKVWFMQALKESLSSSLSTSSSRPSHLRTASRTTPLSASKSVEAHCRASSSARTAARRTSRSSLWQLETFQHKKYQGAGLMMGRGILYHLVQASMPLQCQSMLSCFCYMMAYTPLSPLSPRLTMSGAVERSAACGAITDISV